MKDPFYTGAFVRNPVTKVIAQVVHMEQAGDSFFLKTLNSSLIFPHKNEFWDLIDPVNHFDSL